MEIVMLFVLLGLALLVGIFSARSLLKKDSRRGTYPQSNPGYLPRSKVLPHIPGTDKHGKRKSEESTATSASSGCATIAVMSCGSSDSSGGGSDGGGGFGGGDSGGGGASNGCASTSSCSSASSCSSGSSCSGGGGGCGGGGGD